MHRFKGHITKKSGCIRAMVLGIPRLFLLLNDPPQHPSESVDLRNSRAGCRDGGGVRNCCGLCRNIVERCWCRFHRR